MAVRTKRYFSDQDKKDFLKELANWRGKCIAVCTKAPINGEIYKLADKLISDIDIAAEALTGDRTYLHSKPHSAS